MNSQTISSPCSIYYDMQRNSFYRINKQTGDQKQTYVNGENLPQFKPNISGFEHHRRQSLAQQGKPKLYSATGAELMMKKPSKLDTKLNFHTINSDINLSQKESKFYQALKSQRLSNYSQYQFNPNSTKYLRLASLKTIQKQKGDNKFYDNFRKYQKIRQDKIKNNHSPLKDKEGSVEKRDILDRLCITKNNFKQNLNMQDKQKQMNEAENARKQLKFFSKDRSDLLEQYSVEKQIKREQKIRIISSLNLSKLNKSFDKSEKSLERDKKRNINLKKLQKQMLRKNELQQMQMYFSKI